MSHVRTSTQWLVSSPTGITPAAYASGDVIGAVTELAGAVLDFNNTGVLLSLCMTDATNTKAAVDVYFFRSAPVTTVGADNAAFALADSDLPLLLGRVGVAAADFVTAGPNAEATERGLSLVLKSAAGSKSIYYCLVARGSITLAAVTDLRIAVGILQD